MQQNRRDILDLAVRAMALPGAAAFFDTWLAAAPSHNHSDVTAAPPEPPFLRDYAPKFFDPEDFQALQAFTEILIPTDDTPGAREAHCAHFIDFVQHSSNGYAPEKQQGWRKAMEALKTAGFHSASATDRVALVEAISAPERNHSTSHAAYFAYRLIKQENTFAFYTSRSGMIGALDYRGNSYNVSFPACTHPEHKQV